MMTTTTMYRIYSAASGAILGDYEGETGSDAIRAMLRDAGCDESVEPDRDLRVEVIP